MLSLSEFNVAYELMQRPTHTSLESLVDYLPQAEDETRAALACLREQKLVDGFTLTPAGREALQPYRVNNAVIMAAGLASRMCPISYETPKGLLTVKGEVLIERQIKQLREAGIQDITIVVGYKKEAFSYLADAFDVELVVNPDYATCNNTSTLWQVKDKLANTFVCSADDYFTTNPFESYVYQAYYAASYVAGDTDEWTIEVAEDDRITSVAVGGKDAWVMLGHVYFDQAFSSQFVEILEAEYDIPETKTMLWESLYIKHISELNMWIRRYPEGSVWEFDSLDEARDFDPDFVSNLNSTILGNIAGFLNCDENDICDCYPLTQGITNLSCHIRVGEHEYVYRHPGHGTEKIISRKNERQALEIARDLGLDKTFIYEDETAGWKISHFIRNAQNLDPQNDDHLRRGMEMFRTLHTSNSQLEQSFDYVDEGLRYEQLLLEHGPVSDPAYDVLKEKALRLKTYFDQDDYPLVMSHNDAFMLNFLLNEEDEFSLIDWEYAGMSDPANDFATFAVCCELTKEQSDRCIDYYLGRPADFAERRHFWASLVLAGWCWYIWGLEREAVGETVGAWLEIYHRYAVQYIDDVLSWYESPQQA